jgi:hypothetical protein
MAMLEFAKGAKSISFTVMQMGPKVNVSAEGSGLMVAAARRAETKVAEPLKADPDVDLPVPTRRTMVTISTTKLPGSELPFRTELEASIPAGLSDVLAFYRAELTKRGWQEKTQENVNSATMAAEQAQIELTSPEGPAQLKLGRDKGETTVHLVQRNPDAAAKADIMPRPGQARLMLGNIGPKEASLTINKQTIKVAAGAGGPQSPKGPMLDLPPGTYQYALRVPGRPVRTASISIAAGDAWGLMVGPTGEPLPLQMY